MRNLILRHRAGKTTRLLAMSEFHDAPIICVNDQHKRQILNDSRRWGYNIPLPITANELLGGKMYGSNTYRQFLVDESQDVISELVAGLTRNSPHCVIGMTTTDSRI